MLFTPTKVLNRSRGKLFIGDCVVEEEGGRDEGCLCLQLLPFEEETKRRRQGHERDDDNKTSEKREIQAWNLVVVTEDDSGEKPTNSYVFVWNKRF